MRIPGFSWVGGEDKNEGTGLHYLTVLGGLAAGAALMYWLDPLGGRARRSHTKEQVLHRARGVVHSFELASRDLAHRTRGLFAETLARLREGEVDDAVLVERVRARLGRVCSHPGAIEVSARNGRVELKGLILARERLLVLAAISRVRGVLALDDDLEPHATAEHLPSLQGGTPVARERFNLFQEQWSPATRLVMGSVGAALVTWGLGQRGPLRVLLGAAGGGLLLRALTNLEFRRSIDVSKAIQVQAPVRDVFAFWQAFENFPRFMTHVREVRRTSDGCFHWRVEGPAGASFEWDAEITQMVPNRLLAWKSVGSPLVENTGLVRFDELPGGATRVTVRLSYHPPGGAVGHAFAKLLGADPKREMDDDLLRFKALIENGGAGKASRERSAPGPILPPGRGPTWRH